MRIGIHAGKIVAGITGSNIVRYDIYGDDVLIANKMESLGVPGRINVSYEITKILEAIDEDKYSFELNRRVYMPTIHKRVKCYFVNED